MLRWLTAGESHGPALVATLEGMPAGIAITTDTIRTALARRRLGYGRGSRQKWEKDEVEILAGIRHGYTTGAPITIKINNTEWPKWDVVMSADPVPPEALLIDAGTGDEREVARNKRLTRPRPGHADLPGMLSYGHEDARNILERASARETAARVALGAIAEALLDQVANIRLVSHVVAVGNEHSTGHTPTPDDADALDKSPVRTLNPDAEKRFTDRIDAAKKAGDTVGGIAEVIAYGVPIGLGSHVSADRRIDAHIAAALMSIQSVKGVEIGDGFTHATLPGSKAQDEITTTPDGALTRIANHAGGIEGGTTNGQPIIARAAFKPISTIPHALRTIDLDTGEPATALHQRSDACHIVPGAVIAQAEIALVLARALLERTGGNSLKQVTSNLATYLEEIATRL
ncbi:MAG: chorismate synthase [Actinomycetaceae bacterium]|nr:chorismate synthase [Actinomycetaceae bacterium]